MSEYTTAWQAMGYTHHDVAHDVAVSGERCRADHDRIRALEAENAQLRETLGEAFHELEIIQGAAKKRLTEAEWDIFEDCFDRLKAAL